MAAFPPGAWDLHHLTLAAFYYSPDLDVARARWGVAQGAVLTAGGRPEPALTAALGYNADAAAGVTPWIPEGVLDLPLDVAGKRGLRIAEARQRSESARFDLLEAAWQVRSSVRSAYIDLFLARAADSLFVSQEALQTEVVRILQAQVAAGEASPVELTRARVDLANSRVAAQEAERGAVAANAALADAVGVPPAAMQAVRLSFDELSRAGGQVPPDALRRRALLNRADLLSSLAAYEAAQRALQLEVRKQYPDLSLGPGFQLDQTDAKWTLGLAVSLPLLSRNRGPIAEAAARREEAAATFLALQSRILGEVDRSTVAASAAASQVASADTLLSAVRRQSTLAQAGYDAGEISRLELLGLQVEVGAIALARLDALGAAQRALGTVEDAMQAPLDVEPWVLEAPQRTSGRNQEGGR